MRVLIISHNPISTYQSMGKTMLSLFCKFKKDELYQLYIYPSVPDIDLCESYYRITDKSVLKGIFSRYVKGEIIKPNLQWHRKFENEKDQILYNNPKNNKAYRRLAREFIWKVSPWWNKNLQKWIDKVKPDCIFLATGNYAFTYDIALKIAEKYKSNIISYICDDYYFVKKPSGFWEKIHFRIVKKKINKTLKNSYAIVTICKELKESYYSAFKRKTIQIMTGANHKIETLIHSKKRVTSMTYMGNLSCNRDKSIYEVGKVLDEINSSQNTQYCLNIYTTLNDELIKKFKNIKSIKLHNFVSGEEFIKVFWKTELFLHVEDFNPESIDRVKHSVSTKIADILSSGIPLVAFGPSNVASMAHLLRNQCAMCVTNKDDLRTELEKIFLDSKMRDDVAKRGLITARRYHNAEVDSQKLHSFIETMYG